MAASLWVPSWANWEARTRLVGSAPGAERATLWQLEGSHLKRGLGANLIPSQRAVYDHNTVMTPRGWSIRKCRREELQNVFEVDYDTMWALLLEEYHEKPCCDAGTPAEDGQCGSLATASERRGDSLVFSKDRGDFE
jgi:hypothetical protein